MSVSKYIEEFNTSVQGAIQKNIAKAEENPYPAEEIKQIRESEPESALAKMFGENGQLIDPLGNQGLRFAAIDQDKDLYNRLYKGNRYKERLKNNERLENLNAEDYLNSIYSKFRQESAKASSLGSKIDIEQLLDPANIDDFEEVSELGFDIDTSYVDIETIQSAFNEMVSSNKSENQETQESSAINPVSEEEQEIEPDTNELAIASPPEEEAVIAEVESTGSLNIPEEAEPIVPSPVNTDEVKPITEEPSLEEPQENIASLEQTSPEITSISENLSIPQPEEPVVSSPVNQDEVKTPDLSDMLGSVENSISNISNVTNLSEISNLENLTSNAINTSESLLNQGASDLFEGDIISFINNLTEAAPNISNIETNKITSNLTSSIFDQDLSSLTESVSNIGDKSNISNLIEKSSTFSSFPTSEVVKPEPITREDINKVGQDISSSVSSGSLPSLSIGDIDTRSRSERKDEKRTERQTERAERKAERQETKQDGVSVNSDYSALEKRLKNIELLLMGPLEVKIKN